MDLSIYRDFLVDYAGEEWFRVIFFGIIAIITILWLAGAGCFYLFLRGHIIARSEKSLHGKIFDVISLHTYKPYLKRGETMISERGQSVAMKAVILSNRFHCPILVAVGQTMKWTEKMECEVYKDLIEALNPDSLVVTGIRGNVRDTKGEVAEMEKMSLEKGFKEVLVVGSWPHMVRISNYWKPIIDKGKIKINFVGVHIPLRFYLWELAAWLFDGMIFGKILPRRYRELALNMISRRGP